MAHSGSTVNLKNRKQGKNDKNRLNMKINQSQKIYYITEHFVDFSSKNITG
jgi:hypothetical protein